MVEDEQQSKMLVNLLMSIGKDVRSTPMAWAYEGKKLDAAVKRVDCRKRVAPAKSGVEVLRRLSNRFSSWFVSAAGTAPDEDLKRSKGSVVDRKRVGKFKPSQTMQLTYPFAKGGKSCRCL